MMLEVATLRVKQYGEYRLSVLNDNVESIKHRILYLLKFKVKFEIHSELE